MDVIKAPNEKLRIKTKPVKKITPGLLLTLKQMIKLTKTFKDDGFISVINPKILSLGKRQKTYFEGCLSIPDVYGEVKRYTNIKVSFMNEAGKPQVQNLKGVPAWIFQHEMDHLNGMLFSDRVLEQKGKFYKWVGRDKTGTDNFEEMTL